MRGRATSMAAVKGNKVVIVRIRIGCSRVSGWTLGPSSEKMVPSEAGRAKGPKFPRRLKVSDNKMIAVRAVPPGIAVAFQEHRVLRRLRRHLKLFVAGDPVPGLYLVEAGHLRVVRGGGSRSFVLHYEGPGGMLGETAFFLGRLAAY